MTLPRDIAASLGAVRARIGAAARAAARAPEEVTLIAVSKTHGPDAVRAAYEAGQRDFGESYAQELVEKAAALEGLPELRWHFIGHLQSNKAKLVAKVVHAVHSLDSAALARELGKRAVAAGRGPLSVLVEVNVGREPQKHGAAPEDVAAILAVVRAEPSLVLRGLMTVPPAGDEETARRVFDGLRVIRDAHGGKAALPDLSMGMSQDLEAAIAAGATMVRVGTAIFGERAPRG